jgi:Protein of unknown function (DUF2599)
VWRADSIDSLGEDRVRNCIRIGLLSVLLAAAVLSGSRVTTAHAFSLCGSKIKSAVWEHRDAGWTLAVTPSSCGFATARLEGKLMLEQATSSAKPPPGKPKGWDPNPNSLLEQLECHAYIVSVVAPSKASWNLDSWRPAVPWWIEVFDFCNPPVNGYPVLPSIGSSPAPINPLPFLPSSPYQPLQPLPTIGGPGHAETTGGVTHTWTNYTNAGGTQGPSIASNATVQITCAIQGFRVADGNTWWYKIASSPWNDAYYASADAFYNNGATSGSLIGTPFVDPSVPTCNGSAPPSPPPPPPPPPPATHAETTGGVTHTWTNYTNAGGTQGPSIASNATVQITCAIQGFRVADGNTWWYKIASSPWNDAYYASADAFYNNGATSGSLIGTPFVDPSVPTCNGASIARTQARRSHRTRAYKNKLSVIKRSGSVLLRGASRAKVALVELDLSPTKCTSFAKTRDHRTAFVAFYVARSQRFALSVPARVLRTRRNTYLCAFLLTAHGKHAIVNATS